MRFALESYSDKPSNKNKQDLRYCAHGGYLGHHVHYVEDRSPPELMIQIEASSQRELAKADLIDKKAKPYNLPTEEMERLYLCNGEFKPLAPFQSCAKCGRNLIDEPAKNKSVVRDNKRVQLQWEKNSTTVANFLEGKGVSLKDKKGNPTTKVPNPRFLEEPLMCHCWQQCMSHIAGGYFCCYLCSPRSKSLSLNIE